MTVRKQMWLKTSLALIFLLHGNNCRENEKKLPKPLMSPAINSVLIAEGWGRLRLRRGHMLDKDEMYFLGEFNHQQGLYYSKDGGTTWQKKLFTNAKIYLPIDTAVTNDKTWLVDEAGQMFYSADRGDNWKFVNTPNKYRFTDIVFHQNIGYAIVNKTVRDMNTYTIKPGIQILRTTDGGQNWRICYEDRFTSGVIYMALWQENLAIVILNDKTTLWTADQGKHWKRLFKTDPKFIDEVAFNKEGKLWAVAGEQGIYYSTDKGHSWQHFEDLPSVIKNKRWLSVAFNHRDYGVCSASDGTLVITKNGGQTWGELKTTIPLKDSGGVMRVMIGEQFIILNKNGDVYRIPLPE